MDIPQAALNTLPHSTKGQTIPSPNGQVVPSSSNGSHDTLSLKYITNKIFSKQDL